MTTTEHADAKWRELFAQVEALTLQAEQVMHKLKELRKLIEGQNG